ncbi:acyl CoA:acetate/3-ketoacid CoA transferase [Ideonella sp.]|uniref:acyl CoA:acetate/3-ketoacid CoA transferase n=1 Tax=Ideonella sp. TaxID=1929293 RepID=UPI003BB4B124
MNMLTPAQAAGLIQSGQTVVCAGFVGAGHAEAVTRALEARFLQTGQPRDLTLFYAAGQGDRENRGVNHFGHAGLVQRIIGGHWISAPKLGALVAANQVEAWNLPQGVITHLFRAIAGGKSGVVTRIGLHTFVDPEHDGGRLTPRTATSALEPRVQRVTLGGELQLFYPGLPVDVALIRATSADEHGNLSTEDEPFHQDLLAIAQAAHNSGGIVIAQVKRVVPAGTLSPNAVRVPGILIDHLVLTEDADDHWMTFGEQHNPAYTQRPADAPAAPAAALDEPLDARRIIQRRAFLELQRLRRPVVNLGVGMPAGIGRIAQEEGHSDFTVTLEAGPIGGTPADKLSFGASAYPEAIIDHAAMFDFYDGGGLDIAFLGLAEFDGLGNVNVSRFGDRMAGVGGFINISQSARRVVFMGTLTAGGLQVAAEDGALRIVQEGRTAKLVARLQHLSFNGPYVASLGREVTYITERAVFALRDGQLMLTEVAPGIDVPTQVLALCGCPVAVAPDLRLMDGRLFRPPLMGRAENP